MAIQEAPKSAGSQTNETGAFSHKLSRETIILRQKDLKEKAVNHPLYKEAVSKTARKKGLKLDLTKPFEFEDDVDISNYDITFKYRRDEKDPTIKRFTVTKRFSISGPMQYEEGVEDEGPFVTYKMTLTYNTNPHITYDFQTSDNSRSPIHLEDTQEAVDMNNRFLDFLAF